MTAQIKRNDSVGDFHNLMLKIRGLRRKIVRSLVAGDDLSEPLDLTELEKATKWLEAGLNDGFRRDFDVEGGGPHVSLQIQDELWGLRKDSAFLQWILAGKSARSAWMDGSTFLELIVNNHPGGPDAFRKEMENVGEMLERMMAGNKKCVMITDWDGTMKNYGAQYSTCFQEACSAVVLCQFANKFTTLASVLTAGPLRGPGILDLTAIPDDGPIMFGGSWGREWLLGGKKHVNESNITPDGRDALGKFADKITSLHSSPQTHFSHFSMVGSGFQQKVDRVSLGIQSVAGQVTQTEKDRYLGAVQSAMDQSDPDHKYLCSHVSNLDMEVILKVSDGQVWDKALGVGFLLEILELNISETPVLVCGDTESDLPMLYMAQRTSPKGTHAIFVNPGEALGKKVKIACDEEKCCLVSCPEVIHAAMGQLVLKYQT